MKLRFWGSFIAVVLLATTAWANEYKMLYPGFPKIRDSKAYQKFATRPLSEFSKILYLIDRYGDAKIQINYDAQNYMPQFATTVARWFLARNYKKQTAMQWIRQWCSRSILGNKIIYIKLPDGKFVIARQVLSDELKALEEVVIENNRTVAELQPAPVPAPTPIPPAECPPTPAAAPAA